jgi:hypothetical protein
MFQNAVAAESWKKSVIEYSKLPFFPYCFIALYYNVLQFTCTHRNDHVT